MKKAIKARDSGNHMNNFLRVYNVDSKTLTRSLCPAAGPAWRSASSLDTLVMPAILEVIRTLQVYLKLGRGRVTFILDTALAVLIGELMGPWFREYAPRKCCSDWALS